MIYLDNAATSFPKPPNVIAEVTKCLSDYCANPGRGSHDLSIRSEEMIFKCRQSIASLINADNPMEIIFTKNTTESLNIAVKGLLKPGDHVITSMIEHNSVLRPLNTLCSQGIELSILPVNIRGYLDIKSIEKSLKPNTKAIVLNHGSNVLGTIQDIENVGNFAKSKGLIFIVDSAQTIGFCDIDVKKMKIDLLAFPGHKSLMGMQGVGGLYISKYLDIKSIIEGGTGSNSNSMIQPTFYPDKLESGTLNTPGIVSLEAGISFIQNITLKSIRHHEIELMEQLTSELRKLNFIKIYGEDNPKLKCPVLSFNMDGLDSSEAGNLYNKYNICVRTSYHCAPLIHKILSTESLGTIRVSPGFFNCSNDIDEFVKITKKIYLNKWD